MAKKRRLIEQAHKKEADVDALIEIAMQKLPGKNSRNQRNKESAETKKISLSQESSSIEVTPSVEIKKPSQDSVLKRAGFNLSLTTIRLLRQQVTELKDLYEEKGPDRNHIVDVAIRRFIKDMEGEQKEELIKELLILKQASSERQGPPKKH